LCDRKEVRACVPHIVRLDQHLYRLNYSRITRPWPTASNLTDVRQILARHAKNLPNIRPRWLLGPVHRQPLSRTPTWMAHRVDSQTNIKTPQAQGTSSTALPVLPRTPKASQTLQYHCSFTICPIRQQQVCVVFKVSDYWHELSQCLPKD